MKKYYKDEKNNQAFERWVNLMPDLFMKHGPGVLKRVSRQSLLGTGYIVWLDADHHKRHTERLYVLLEYGTAA